MEKDERGLSRRSVMLTGAGLAAAGVVVGAGVPPAVSHFSGDDTVPGQATAAGNLDVPVMVHLRDAPSGQFDVFFGTHRVQVTDRGFAARLTAAARG